MATKYQYNEETKTSNWPLYTPGNIWGAQTFSDPTGFTATYVELLLYRSGSGGNVTVSIKAVDGSNHPTGADLAVSNAVDCTGITTVHTGAWITFTFLSSVELSASTTYAIVARNDTAIANTIRWNVDTATPSYANGNFVTSSDSGANWTTRTWDSNFRVWGEASVTYSELSGTITGTSSVENADLNLITWSNLVGTITAVSTVGPASLGSVTVAIDVETSYVKRLVAAGNNQIWIEDI